MSKKLLKEGTIRKFMKLANIGPLANSFVNENPAYGRDDELEDEGASLEDEGASLGGEEAPLGDEDPLGDLDVVDDEELPGEEVDLESAARAALEAVADLATAAGVEVEVEDAAGAEDAEGEETYDFGPADEAPVEDAPVEEEPMDDEEDVMAEAVMSLLDRAGIEVVDDKKITEDLVKKVSARVARRILKEYL